MTLREADDLCSAIFADPRQIVVESITIVPAIFARLCML